ncbi:MAG: deoxyribodipyrimidine photo-lyase [Cyanobacteria bacterium P01_H01_bin.74]
MGNQLVWFKRDLRVNDHAPLIEAAKRGPVVCVYVYEPELYQANDFDACHLVFINQSLVQLKENLARLGSTLICLHNNLPQAFESICSALQIQQVWSHEETGNDITYKRDIRLGQWLQAQGIGWTEVPQTGVVRRLKNRDGWARQWRKRMEKPVLSAPDPATDGLEALKLPEGFNNNDRSNWNDWDVGILDAKTLELAPSTKSKALAGGENQAHQTLNDFLNERGEHYQKEMSSPLVAFDSCSRISPYLAYGNLSMRQVVHQTKQRVAALQEIKGYGSNWLRSMRSFEKRLHWHCHFMQKLEDEPTLEWQNLCRSFDGLRENDWNDDYFEAWKKGETGYPMIDACMRALHQHGWINFRMRAMLVSFASYQLWLDWRPTSVYLARQFLDYEPGIHYSQVQMQSGVTGINAIRIYSPIKQVLDQDPKGEFIKQYCPELAALPAEYIAEPYTMPPLLQQMAGIQIGKDYPLPVVDHKTAYKAARDKIYQAKRTPETRALAQAVFQKHGSRQNSRRQSGSKQGNKQVSKPSSQIPQESGKILQEDSQADQAFQKAGHQQ